MRVELPVRATTVCTICTIGTQSDAVYHSSRVGPYMSESDVLNGAKTVKLSKRMCCASALTLLGRLGKWPQEASCGSGVPVRVSKLKTTQSMTGNACISGLQAADV